MKTTAFVATGFAALALAQNQTAAPATSSGGLPAGVGCGFDCVLRPLMYPRCKLATTIVDALVAALAKESGLDVSGHPSGESEGPHSHGGEAGGDMGSMPGMGSAAASSAAASSPAASSAAASSAGAAGMAGMDMGGMQMSMPAAASTTSSAAASSTSSSSAAASTSSSAAATSSTAAPAMAMGGMGAMDMGGMHMSMPSAAASSSTNAIAVSPAAAPSAAMAMGAMSMNMPAASSTSSSSSASSPAAAAATVAAATPVVQSANIGDLALNVETPSMPRTNPKPNNGGMSMKYASLGKRQGLDAAVGAISSLASKGGANLLNVILEGIAKSPNGTASAVGLALSPDVKACLCSGTPARRLKVAADTCIPNACKAYTTPLPMASVYIGMINYLCEGQPTFTQIPGGFAVGPIVDMAGGLQNLPSLLGSLGGML